ncbi:MAG: helix-turn-helix transcriptional regulator [Chloroflexi bacterium]|nr:helix-turn-helix transcriptional regulator [Chloroflexota bacterium]
MPYRNEDRCEVVVIHKDRVQAAEAQMVDGLTATRLAETFKALSDPARVRIISALAVGELCVCDIAAAVGASQSAVSHQLRLLRQLRLLKRRKEGRMAYYSLDDAHVEILFRQGLDHVAHG